MDLLHPVHVNIAESGESLEVKAEVPGFSEKEIEVSVEPSRLTITGKRETETKSRETGQDGLFGILLGPDPASRGFACKRRCREGNRNFEERRVAVDDAEGGQGENDRNQVQGGLIARVTYGRTIPRKIGFCPSEVE